MKTKQIFIGDIRKCLKYEFTDVTIDSIYDGDQCIGCDFLGSIDKEDEIYKKNAILIKIKDKGYIDLERLNSILDYIKIYKNIDKKKVKLNDIVMSNFTSCVGKLFVDEDTLVPYNKEKQHISLHKLKKELKTNKK